MALTKAIVDKLLSNVSQMLVPDGYVSEVVFPEVKASQKTGKLAKYGKQHLRILNTVMGGRGMAPRVDVITRSQASFEIESHGLEGVVTEDDRINVEDPYNAEKDEVIGLTTLIWIGKEKALADSLTSTSVLTQNTTLSGTSQWSDYTNSDPLANWKTAHNTIYGACGMHPNKAVLSRAVYNTLKYSPKVLDALGYKYVRSGQLTTDDVARAMDVEQLLLASAVFNSANEGQADSVGAIWGKHAVFMVAPKDARPYQQSLGYYLTLAGKRSREVFKYSIPNPPNAMGIIVQDHYDQLISDVGCGYLIKDAVA